VQLNLDPVRGFYPVRAIARLDERAVGKHRRCLSTSRLVEPVALWRRRGLIGVHEVPAAAQAR
jgi:hypothetical protein